MTLDREYEKFNGGPNRPNQDRIHITMNAKGVLYINANAHRLLGRPEAVQLFFNRKKDKIAVKPAHALLADAFPHTSPFCLHYGIRLSATERFVLPDIDDEGILHLDLRTTVTVKRPRRSRKP